MRRLQDLTVGVAFLALLSWMWTLDDAPDWLEQELRGRASASGGFRVEAIHGWAMDLEVLAGQVLRLTADQARVREAAVGPISIGGLFEGLEFDRVTGMIGEEVRVRAERGLWTDGELKLSGCVRLDRPDGQGLLFAPVVELATGQDRLRAQMAVLAPDGTDGGLGGRALIQFASTLEGLLRASDGR